MNITVTIAADAGLLSAINRIADSLSAPRAAAPAPVAPAAEPVKEVKQAPAKAEPKQEGTGEAPAEPRPSVNGKSISLEKVREAVQKQSQAGKRDAIKALLQEFGAEKVTALQEDQYANFFEKVNAL